MQHSLIDTIHLCMIPLHRLETFSELLDQVLNSCVRFGSVQTGLLLSQARLQANIFRSVVDLVYVTSQERMRLLVVSQGQRISVLLLIPLVVWSTASSLSSICPDHCAVGRACASPPLAAGWPLVLVAPKAGLSVGQS